MKILGMLWKNLRRGVATLRFPEAPPDDQWLSRLGSLRPLALYRLRHVPVPLHCPRHHIYCSWQAIYLGIRPFTMHVLRSLRGWMQRPRFDAGPGLPTDLPFGQRPAYQLYVAAQNSTA